MNNLIKLSIVALLVTIGTESFSQIFGVKAGLNLSTLHMKDDDYNYSDEFKMSPGFHFGPTVEFPINEMFSFESGLLLSTKGGKRSVKDTYGGGTYEYESKSRLTMYYLDIPLTAKATFDIGSSKIYGVFGPYIGMGLCGKSKNEFTDNGETETNEETINFGSDKDEDDVKRLDYGLTAGAGIELSSFQIGVNYNLGLANISAYTEEGNKLNNRVLAISVGYKFGGK